MKIKVKPEDFVVQEEATLLPTPEPLAHAIFRLSKQDWDTFDLIDLLSRRLRIPKQDISTGGIKDRYGKTEQLISIKNRGGLREAVNALPPENNFELPLAPDMDLENPGSEERSCKRRFLKVVPDGGGKVATERDR